ncbi:ABC transporter substrate-binding protein [Bradyrhizobium manausense]|uniref:ABC transporter substrate-binding protein n=1 Tax=Bradyrhizobium manausense TaxID=989370 RepID=UPI001BA7E89E|nr:ABC transporter substrate-binding protein [Bradyrhizobium manausense]MBR0684360.1 ABC transporter substrate-binding protein [Bradyrhizobium manausense]
MNGKKITFVASALLVSTMATVAWAGGTYDVGASDTEIKIGNTNPYSGPASAYSIVGKVEEAYFRMVNEQGGVNGRKITFISYDDAFSPPKTVEQTRKLVESDEVLAVFSSLGTAPSLAVRAYMNSKKIPQIFVSSGSSKFGDHKGFPWSIGHQPNFFTEGRVFAKYLRSDQPNAKIGVLYQNDDLGKELLEGLKDGLGDKSSNIAVAIPFEITEPTIDSQVVKIKSAGADVFVNFSTPKAAAQAIRKIGELNWKPVHLISKVSMSIGSVMKPAGLENSEGIISATYVKDYNDAQWKDDAGMKAFDVFMDKYLPGSDKSNALAVYGYLISENFVKVLRQCGDNLTRANLMKQATSLKDMELGLLLPGITVNTSPTDYYPLKQLRLMRFHNGEWELFGPVIDGRVEN